MRQRLSLFLVVTLWATPVLADSDEIEQLRVQLREAFPEASSAVIRPSPVKGLFEVEHGNDILYLSADGKFLMLGDVVEISTRTNITRAKRDQRVAAALNAVGEENMIVIGPKDAKRVITVFTDVDCPYCVKLHQEVPALNREGVRVRYLLYPRGGLESQTYKKSVAVWCSEDRIKAVGIAKAGGAVEMKTCPNPVAQHFKLGQQLSIEGTPAVYLDNGRQVGGYVPAPKLLAAMGLSATGGRSVP